MAIPTRGETVKHIGMNQSGATEKSVQKNRATTSVRIEKHKTADTMKRTAAATTNAIQDQRRWMSVFILCQTSEIRNPSLSENFLNRFDS